MKIKLTGTHLIVGGQRFADGEICDAIGDAEAKALIERGLAEPVKSGRGGKKSGNGETDDGDQAV